MTSFSVIIATRNRPGPFAEALASVRAQRGARPEVVVVMDGSDPVHDEAYDSVLAADGAVQVVRLPATERGHGHSYAVNRGAAVARGDYLCFLDDDDCWIDPDHLARASVSLTGADADLYLADQEAWRGGQRLAPEGGIWLETLSARPDLLGPPDALGACSVAPAVLMALPKHCHPNTTIIRRDLFDVIGGMDPDIRYDDDRDFYLRAVDRARRILLARRVVARHAVPDPSAGRANLSTAAPVLRRLLYQRTVFDKAVLFAQRPEVVAHARRELAWVLRTMARTLATEGRGAEARFVAWQALGARFGLKWLGYCLWLMIRR